MPPEKFKDSNSDGYHGDEADDAGHEGEDGEEEQDDALGGPEPHGELDAQLKPIDEPVGQQAVPPVLAALPVGAHLGLSVLRCFPFFL